MPTDTPLLDTFWHILAGHAVEVQRMLVAVACGALIGWERERSQKGAGFRTNILMSLGACLFALVGLRMHEKFPGSDPLRLVQGVLSGIGFLSGGVIVVQGASIRGLTTATGLWLLTAVGLSAGLGQYFLAIFATLILFIVMSWFRRIEKQIQIGGRMAASRAGRNEDEEIIED
jgi:putative Mg2+ transporter-C (MgtC) family protein